MDIAQQADHIIETLKQQDREKRQAQMASPRPVNGPLVDSATCPHDFFTDGLGQCSNCGTYVGHRNR